MPLTKQVIIAIVCSVIISACQSTYDQTLSCEVEVQFTIDKSLYSRTLVDYNVLLRDINAQYPSTQKAKNEEKLPLKLIKAYVRPDMYILKATVVLSNQDSKTEQVTYYRGSHVDANLANTDGEYQLALEDAVVEAIDKAIEVKKEQCVKTIKSM